MTEVSLNAMLLFFCIALKIHPASAADSEWDIRTPSTAEEIDGAKSNDYPATILSDSSVQLCLASPTSSVVTLSFWFPKPTEIRRVKIELLPDLRFQDGRLGRNPERPKLMLFDIETRVRLSSGAHQRIESSSCTISHDPDDPGNTDGVNLIDALSDTGWKIPRTATPSNHPIVVLSFRDPVTLPEGGSFALSFDVGGHTDLDTPARYRISTAQD